ncbi:carbohydrate kinase family protein [Duganella qianjiadongensis]|uniref:Carbohydrate kinase n=1 Tax=Duganella qianjiadongensis TaxID=2692176 RepID=A0ABW9VGJ9_9BURK|nr:carbohydrate kinase [Duganella qianjiadongensis]MYM38636.1 carbohydrate kinase [Duganella qianjiadongensis]
MHEAPVMLCAGEALTDMIHQGHEQWISQVGGSVWNVARALAALGERTAFAGAISNDRFGAALWNASAAVGLDMRLIQRVQRSPLLAIVEQGEPPSYFFVGDDSADLHFNPAALPAGWSGALRWAHFGGISLARQPLAGTLVALAGQLKAQGVAISYDPNFRNLMDQSYQPTLRTMAALADVIKVSDDDLRGLFPGATLDQALQQLRAANPAAYCLLTRGGQGATLFHGSERADARAPQVEVVDTVGAGDASVAGLLHSLACYPQRNLQAHLHAALAAGSAACLQAGANPPQAAAMNQFFEQLQGDSK